MAAAIRPPPPPPPPPPPKTPPQNSHPLSLTKDGRDAPGFEGGDLDEVIAIKAFEVEGVDAFLGGLQREVLVLGGADDEGHFPGLADGDVDERDTGGLVIGGHAGAHEGLQGIGEEGFDRALGQALYACRG